MDLEPEWDSNRLTGDKINMKTDRSGHDEPLEIKKWFKGGIDKGGIEMEHNYKCTYFQYAFFINSSNELLPCDEGTRKFLQTLKHSDLYTHLLAIKLSASVTNSTVILRGTSYNLRLTPLNDAFFAPFLGDFKPAYLVTMQNQAHIALIIKELRRVQFRAEAFADIFDDMPNAMFIDDPEQNILYLNRKYEEISGMRFEQMVGNKLSDLEAKSVLRPIISPTILLNKNEVTALQTIDGKKNVVVAGFPIYSDTGVPILILTCVNEISGIDALSAAGDISGANRLDQFERDLNHNTGIINVIAESASMRTVLNDSIAIAQYPVPVLILGESGTGKEIIANVIHASSQRRSSPFVKINCSAISPSLIESELFGYAGGSFTGASREGKAGLLESADGGTLLLDEIGDMPLELQAKLLRVLQSGEFYRVGGREFLRVNVRIIASTNKDLRTMTKTGEFRADLYFRLNTVSIFIPPLRARKEDIESLLLHYTYICNKLYGMNKTLSKSLIDLLKDYGWPGNIRELENVVKRLAITCTEEVLTPESFYAKYGRECAPGDPHAPAFEDQPVDLVGSGASAWGPYGLSASGSAEIRTAAFDHQSPDLILSGSTEVKASDLPASGSSESARLGASLRERVEEFERAVIEEAMAKSRNTREAAARLGISQATLLRKRKRGSKIPEENEVISFE